MTPKPPSVGDRVERAIEDRADAEREIERGEAKARPARSLARTVFWLTVTAISLYAVAPSLIDVLGSWRDLSQLSIAWFPAMAALQGAALACLWVVQRVALKRVAWPDVIDSQLAGNALAKIAPAGGALGAALQYRMLVQAGLERGRAVAGLTAANLLTFAIVLALPVLVVPAIIRGAVHRSLVEATVIGLVAFAVLLAAGVAVLALDSPLAWIGRVVQRVRNRLRRHAPPLTRLPQRLMRERDRLLSTLGPRWKRALLAAAGRWAFDYATLLGGPGGGRLPPATGARSACLLCRTGPGSDPNHAGRARLRRGGVDGHPGPGGGQGRRRGARNACLSSFFILATAAARPCGCDSPPSPLRPGGPRVVSRASASGSRPAFWASSWCGGPMGPRRTRTFNIAIKRLVRRLRLCTVRRFRPMCAAGFEPATSRV